jgi:SAM-dependent methyltransferase
MILVFGITLFLSATLLFLLQPMVAKMILPLLGGTPAVWNTCMVFFQALLLAGYAYAHAVPARLGVRRQILLHVGLLLVPFLVLPIAISKGFLPPTGSNPIPWLLWLLLLSVGLPFFVVSTTAPLLQHWLAGTGHRSAKDPYYLYAASNVGSMLALVGYPLLLEPRLRLQEQSGVWTMAYAGLVALIGLCALWTWRSTPRHGSAPAETSPATLVLPEGVAGQARLEEAKPLQGEPTPIQRLRWTALAFVPSSLLLGVTTYFTTDIAAIPLFWVVPLAIYLVTFILAFSGALPGLRSEIRVWLPPLVLWLLFSILIQAGYLPYLSIPLHLTVFFLAAWLCHGELAASRPASRHLTQFYLWMSFGGVLGGLFNVLVAPFVFHSIAEYPLMLALVFLFMPAGRRPPGAPPRLRADVAWACAIGLLTAALILAVPTHQLPTPWLGRVLTYGLPLLACFFLLRRPARFGLSLSALVLTTAFLGGRQEEVLHRERSFFGVLTVARDADGRFNQLFHGSTLHGQQYLDPARRDEPSSYYRPGGAIWQVFHAFSGPSAKPRVAVIGLGTGTLAVFAERGQKVTYYEIDPAVLRIARDPRWFTFLQDSRASVDVVMGDARLRLVEAPDKLYDMLVLDAFSSDAIPVHLITREAIQLYLQKLQSDGVLVFHISNRYLDLEPVVRAEARDLALVARVQHDSANLKPGEQSSIWVVMARRESDLGPLATDHRWQELVEQPGVASWSDDFSNLVSVMRWMGKDKHAEVRMTSPAPAEKGEGEVHDGPAAPRSPGALAARERRD